MANVNVVETVGSQRILPSIPFRGVWICFNLNLSKEFVDLASQLVDASVDGKCDQ